MIKKENNADFIIKENRENQKWFLRSDKRIKLQKKNFWLNLKFILDFINSNFLNQKIK